MEAKELIESLTDEQIIALQKIQWWNFDDSNLQDVERFFLNVDEFIQKLF